ncbi:unnamed protein product [Sphagnum jensenii]
MGAAAAALRRSSSWITREVGKYSSSHNGLGSSSSCSCVAPTTSKSVCRLRRGGRLSSSPAVFTTTAVQIVSSVRADGPSLMRRIKKRSSNSRTTTTTDSIAKLAGGTTSSS